MTRRVHRDEEGAVLLMALIFLTVGAVITGALLSFADTDFRTTVNVRSQGRELYAADAAIEAAINNYRQYGTCLSDGPSVNDVSGVTVSCEADPATTGTPANAPPLAVITRADKDSGEDGIRLVSGALTRVRGGAFSNNTINVSAGSELEVSGSVTARWGCNDETRISTTTGIDCDIEDASYPNGNDPPGDPPSTGYVTVVSTAPALAALPTCPASGPVIFSPGTYNDASALNSLFSSCAGRVFHFKPKADGTVGAYYFDFEDSGSHEWSINNPSTIVVGGALASGVDYDNIDTKDVGKRCDENQPGVQFIFGGDSRVNVNSGAMELCADHDATETKQEIAVYGIKTSEATPPTPTQQTLTKTPTTASSPTGHFSNPDNAKVADGTSASASVLTSSSRTITLGGFDVSTIPSTATIDSVTLRFTHQDTGSLNNPDLKATVSGTGAGAVVQSAACGSTANCFKKLTTSTAMHSDDAVLTSVFDSAAKLAGLSVVYEATNSSSNKTFTEALDGLQLEVKYTEAASTAPRFRAQSGCVVTGAYGGSGTCALVRTGGSQSDFAVHGTVYAPLAALDIHLVLVSYQVFKRGIIVRHLRSNVTPSTPCSAATAPIPDDCYPFQLPGLTSGTGDVLFVAMHNGRVRLRALVSFVSGSAPTIKSWSVVNEEPGP